MVFITDNGSTVTVNGDLVVEGTQTILNTSTLQVEDNNIELRKGNNLVGSNGGITINRTSDLLVISHLMCNYSGMKV
ncbi:MAG: hypothetical protein CM15mV89_0750 [Caudoviricetes sp.]|nr:MAG: hypothetical protein CM15mV89_0750 [Caudoviricetes sp.]